MGRLEEIESAFRTLSIRDKRELVDRLSEILDDEWDQEIEEDAKAGRLNQWIEQVEGDISRGRTKPLDEFLDDA